jgi:sialate O-acetylesterase
MVNDWRHLWGLGNFPFYYVQIAPYKYKTDLPIAAELRESQLLSMKMKNTGMAVTMDIGDVRDIHPRNKQEVGRRLSLWALAKTYHQKNVVFSGPLYKKMKIEGSRIRIFFKHCAGGLLSKDSLMQDFQIAGKDRIFKKANIKIDKNTIIVYSGEVNQPVAVRYGWGNAVEPKLFNGYGLPASPFRTDDWPLSTATTLPGN